MCFFQGAYTTELPLSEFLVKGKIRIRVWFSLDFYSEGNELPEDYYTCTAPTCVKLSACHQHMTSHGIVELSHCTSYNSELERENGHALCREN